MPTEYTSQALVEILGVPIRTFRYWIEEGLLPSADYRGPLTRYPEETLIRARAIVALRNEGAKVPKMKRWLRRATPEEIAKKGAPPAPPPVEAPKPAPSPEPLMTTAILPAPSIKPSQWTRIALLPGMELHVRADAGALVARLASEIAERYRAR